MSWASHYIEKLCAGETVHFRPRGNSMLPLIKSGALVTVMPAGSDFIFQLNDIVLCRVGPREYLHKIVGVGGSRFQIGNNRGGVNGWVKREAIFGIFGGVRP